MPNKILSDMFLIIHAVALHKGAIVFISRIDNDLLDEIVVKANNVRIDSRSESKHQRLLLNLIKKVQSLYQAGKDIPEDTIETSEEADG